MSKPMIIAEGLSKRYLLGAFGATTFRDELMSALSRFNLSKKTSIDPSKTNEEFWALKDVSFEIEKGDTIGLIGRNGAGKSTLLKILSRITTPTHGRYVTNGKFAALLEVGTGFHPDLTGLENVYLNGAILGMRRWEIKSKLDSIIEFSGVSEFVNTPVKRYSSGMRVRLAFAVAAHLRQDILFVDEVLAVGDYEFQKKCLGKMSEVAREGRTVVFVSHNMYAVSRLCQKCFYLKDGQLNSSGPSSEIIGNYLKDTQGEQGSLSWENGYANAGVSHFRFHSVDVVDAAGNPENKFSVLDTIGIKYEFSADESIRHFHIETNIRSNDGISVLSFRHYEDDAEQSALEPGRYIYQATIPAKSVNQGSYTISIAVYSNNEGYLVNLDDFISLDINLVAKKNDLEQMVKSSGIIYPTIDWSVAEVD